MFETHLELKDRSKLSKDLDKEVKNIEEELKKEESINNRLESQVSSFMEKRKHEENIIWLKRKRSVLVITVYNLILDRFLVFFIDL